MAKRPQLNIRLEPELLEEIKEAAKRDSQTITEWLLDLIRSALDMPVKRLDTDSKIDEKLAEVLDKKLEAKLDYGLLEIRDTLTAKLEGMVAEKLDEIAISDADELFEFEGRMRARFDEKLAELNNEVNSRLDTMLDTKLASLAQQLVCGESSESIEQSFNPHNKLTGSFNAGSVNRSNKITRRLQERVRKSAFIQLWRSPGY